MPWNSRRELLTYHIETLLASGRRSAACHASGFAAMAAALVVLSCWTAATPV
jgi:hypothetical protein